MLGGSLADLDFTDPPYNVAYEGKTAKRLTIRNDALGVEFGAFLGAACAAMLQVTKGALYICMSSSEIGTLKAAFESAGGHWSTNVIWAKNAFTLGRSDYQRQYEPILYGWPSGTDHYWCGARDQGDVWQHDRPTKNDLHPTMKPVALVERAIRNSSKSRDIVLDPFAGSGTTLMAAEATGRTAALVELDPGYCDVIVQRWQEATGKVAHREDGRPFYQLALEQQTATQGGGTRVRLRPAQSRSGSLVEASANVLVGYLLALGTQRLIYPLFGITTTLATDAVIALLFTLVSLARSYLLRRVFERLAGSP